MTPFDELAPIWLGKLMADLGLTKEQAAGLLGNLGYESNGFRSLQEIHPAVEGSRGGLGVAQWTGPRRVAFENWARNNNLDVMSDEANYGYLLVELRGAYSGTVTSVKQTVTVEDAVFDVGQTYERPGGTRDDFLPGYDGRLRYAKEALTGNTVAPGMIGPDMVRAGDINAAVAAFEAAVRALQTLLKAAQLYAGDVDGDFGPASRSALAAYRASQGA